MALIVASSKKNSDMMEMLLAHSDINVNFMTEVICIFILSVHLFC